MSWYHGFYPLNALCSLSMKLIASLHQGRYICLGLHRSGISSPLETFKGHPKANTKTSGACVYLQSWVLILLFFPWLKLYSYRYDLLSNCLVSMKSTVHKPCFFFNTCCKLKKPPYQEVVFVMREWTPEDGPWQWYGSLLCPYIDLQL